MRAQDKKVYEDLVKWRGDCVKTDYVVCSACPLDTKKNGSNLSCIGFLTEYYKGEDIKKSDLTFNRARMRYAQEQLDRAENETKNM